MLSRLNSLALALMLGAGMLLIPGCGTLSLNPEVKQGSVSFDMTGLTDDFAVVNIDSTLSSKVQQRNEKNTRKNIKNNKFNTAKMFVDGMTKELEKAGIFKKIVKKGGDRVFVITDIRNKITPTNKDIYEVFHETNFQISLNDKEGKQLWTNTIWIDAMDKPRMMSITDVAANQTGLKVCVESAATLAGKELVKALKEALEKGAAEAGK